MNLRLPLPAFVFMLFLVGSMVFPLRVMAQGQVLGIHLLSPGEVSEAQKLLTTPDNSPHYVTIPLTFDDLNYPQRWQAFLDQAHDAHLEPLIRLTTRFENGSWVVPTQADIIHYATFLSSLNWKDDHLTLILFNEPNHADEWGGHLDPQGYANLVNFTLDWFKTEPHTYVLLPAGADLAATNTSTTMDAFSFWKQAFAAAPDMLEKFDGWTSHSYPNPGFANDPWETDAKSLRGYQHELTFLATYTKKDFPVYITETGWNTDTLSVHKLQQYYQVAYSQIWSKDPRIQAVTPFVLQGAPGAFAPFSFLDAKGNPTASYDVYKNLLSQAK